MTLLQSYLEFIKELELLKNITRTAWTSAGKKESTAEHSWRLALFTGIISQEFPELDGKKLLMMALVHDLGEIYDGDISAALLPDPDEKYKSEAGSVSRLLSLLEEPARAFEKKFRDMGIQSRVLSRTLEDAVTLGIALVPYSMAAFFIVGVLKIDAMQYIPYAFVNWIVPIFSLTYGFTGFAIWKINKDAGNSPAESEA